MDVQMSAFEKKGSDLISRRFEENSKKVNNDFRQNNNTHSNKMSFIPVYSKKSDTCHNFLQGKKEIDSKAHPPEESLVQTQNILTFSPTFCQKSISGQPECFSPKTHMRRHSVGFEDMTSSSFYFGHNLTNENRFQTAAHLSHIGSPAYSMNCNKQFSESDSSHPKSGQSNSTLVNPYTKSVMRGNENEQSLRLNKKPLQRIKDKSSKRKSSLNRIDFIHLPPSSSVENVFARTENRECKYSSSDEVSDCKIIQKLDIPVVRKKSSDSMAATVSTKAKEPSSLKDAASNRFRTIISPRRLQGGHIRPQHHRLTHTAALYLHKLSHSTGELESTTDASETPIGPRICLSAQEFEVQESVGQPKDSHVETNSNSASQKSSEDRTTKYTSVENSDIKLSVCKKPRNMCSGYDNVVDVVNTIGDDAEELEKNMELLEIALENADTEDESNPSDKRPNSILRKKCLEEKRELHSILKHTVDEKLSKAPSSILKHRESSEEKEVWQISDLHSILKKSTSEEESCNSSPDIRPILKNASTDEDSSGGTKPRPILKKRTSFSGEHSYMLFPCSNELKPILKKKTSSSSEEQPKPILKSRRKSEDSRCTIVAEPAAGRPRAYSADEGVKALADSFDCRGFAKCDDHKL